MEIFSSFYFGVNLYNYVLMFDTLFLNYRKDKGRHTFAKK